MEVKKFMVIGAGQMGSGIAQVAAQAGLHVVLHDVKEEFVNRGLGVITKNLTRDVEKGRKSEQEKQAILERIVVSTDINSAKDVDFVVEAVVENMDVKTAIFKQLDDITPAHTILASNTSSLPITEIAAVTNRPEKVIGMHFMNPVPVMKLIEVIRGLATSDETYRIVADLSEKMSKVAVEVNDFPGFVSNRVLMPMINEAIYCVYEGVATPESIDEVMKLGMNHPMGPLTLADFIGLDTCLYIMEVLHEGFGDSKYRPCPLLRKYVKAGWLGRKSGRGFYVYE
ncbi:3-hydroxybutyryl-CoA dehydrogenase [Aneurinibacillus aneurinilyticus]|jgi:3-hydroxybutyryl-CoA dehydrogenase|uniref:3-hydroxybutyryl-CoA dehydrogenase n=2 Tax=Aneurinibacillus aneurinilyticus TaxID=1391 RepID=A0A848CW07_ANEAE|nr:3-hydroxybutyryl-CoA dehydrogenase [Aneurinibacillus aneurinilyticus]ERI07032.1 3-hydroxybutyryl-CoA dehydrogenase [Aneurinibacillus aneurinilyticus ATCC 12856]MCI1695931.1 3-hydroxybutyryl-CoA dehydrogenase [Aneurinibacillus aneurinilyticus]MED0671958.1 3-hydroxybutyryl-CoA dehydrogenase [Aneurinibacillus aneurinilyticus]MED0706332.1 3-hydroxybutyryl-CoA dehydrogenase [Aneurinibacillus aneurinilyticus]MED0723606.1 3-hydroxybutyryl-CoA dehydrogenase [Aneurinibacillus aneurinilyticus]